MDNRGDMILPNISTENTLVADAYLSTEIADFVWNKRWDISAIDSILNTSMIAYQANNTRTELEFSNECEAFKQYAIRFEVSSVSCTYDPVLFCNLLDDKIALSKFSTDFGSTTDSPKYPDSVMDLWDIPRHHDCEYLGPIKNFMDTFASATHAENPTGVDSKLLQNILLINSETAKRTIKTKNQLNRQDVNSKLSRNFGTNDRMLRYRRIKFFFFTDTFFVTKKAENSRGYTCVQIFVSDMGYVYVAAMKSVSEFPKALEMFAKEIGVTEAIISDSHKCKKSKEVKLFFNKIGTTLRILEVSTQWANKAGLYVGLFNEVVRKDILYETPPLVFWDYCSKRRAFITNMTAKDLFQLRGKTPHFATFGKEGDISKYVNLVGLNGYILEIPRENYHLLRMFWDAVLALPRTREMKCHNGF